MTTGELTAAIHRNQVNARDTRFDAHMRSMFRKSARMLERQLGAHAANMVTL